MTEARNDLGIVVGTDGSAFADAAVRWAAREAAMRDLPVTLAHVIPPLIEAPHDGRLRSRIIRWQMYRGHQILGDARRLAAETAGTDRPKVREELLFDAVVPSLVQLSKDATMLVVGSRGAGVFGSRRLGSVSAGLCRHALCPTAVIHEREDAIEDTKLPVLVGIDGSPASETATALAFDEASRRGVGLTALHAWSDVGVFPLLGMDWHTYRDEGAETLGERLAGWQERYPDVAVERRLVCDRPAHWLLDEASRAQLVVVGSHGRGGFAGMLLGSVSTAVAEAAEVSVIVARGA